MGAGCRRLIYVDSSSCCRPRVAFVGAQGVRVSLAHFAICSRTILPPSQGGVRGGASPGLTGTPPPAGFNDKPLCENLKFLGNRPIARTFFHLRGPFSTPARLENPRETSNRGANPNRAYLFCCAPIHVPQPSVLSPQSSVLSPQSSVLSPQSSPQSSVLSPQSSVLSPQSSVLSPQSSVLSPSFH